MTATMSRDLIDRATEDAVRYAVVQRMGKQVLAEDALDQIVERLLQTPELWMLVDRIADSHPVAQVLERQSDYVAPRPSVSRCASRRGSGLKPGSRGWRPMSCA